MFKKSKYLPLNLFIYKKILGVSFLVSIDDYQIATVCYKDF